MKNFVLVVLFVALVWWLSLSSVRPERPDPPPPVAAPAKPVSTQAETLPTQPEDLSTQIPTPSPEDIEISNVDSDSDESSWWICGNAKNRSTEPLAVSLSFDVKDSEGAKIADAMDVTRHLAPGQVWKFKAMVLDERGKKFSTRPHVTVYPDP